MKDSKEQAESTPPTKEAEKKPKGFMQMYKEYGMTGLAVMFATEVACCAITFAGVSFYGSEAGIRLIQTAVTYLPASVEETLNLTALLDSLSPFWAKVVVTAALLEVASPVLFVVCTPFIIGVTRRIVRARGTRAS